MKELELKYGCNPNQKPARIYHEGRRELPVDGAQRQARATSTLWTPSTPGSWSRS